MKGGAIKNKSKKKNGKEAPKKKRAAPKHAKVQTEVIKMIAAKDGINYPQAMKKLKEYIAKALGKSWDDAKAEGITWYDALVKTKAYLQ